MTTAFYCLGFAALMLADDPVAVLAQRFCVSEQAIRTKLWKLRHAYDSRESVSDN